MRRVLLSVGVLSRAGACGAWLAGVTAGPASAALPPDEWYSPCRGPQPTCVSAHASDAGAAAPAAPGCDPMPVDARTALGRWAAASKDHLPIPDAERLRLRHSFPGRSGQEIALTAELHGPVDAADLARRYDWTAAERPGEVALTAVPKDDLERLFYGHFAVTLETRDWRPVSVCFAADGGPQRVVALKPWLDDAAATPRVRLAAATDGPGRPRTPVRTADVSEDRPRPRLDVPAVAVPADPAAVPPAPTACPVLETPLRPVPEPNAAGDTPPQVRSEL